MSKRYYDPQAKRTRERELRFKRKATIARKCEFLLNNHVS